MSNDSERLIDRKQEIAEFRDLLKMILNKQAFIYPIRELVGPGGIGKTRLIKAIIDDCSHLQIPSLLIDFATFPVEKRSIHYIIHHLISNIPLKVRDIEKRDEILSAISVDRADLSLISDGNIFLEDIYIDQILELFREFNGVTIFDSMEHAPSSIIHFLSERLILPLSSTGTMLFIFASRTDIDWGSSKYRVRRRGKAIDLKLFSPSETREQLSDSSFDHVTNEVQSITSGHPESNEVVIDYLEYIQQIENRRISREVFGDYEARLIVAVVEKARERHTIPESLYRAFYVLSILRVFDINLPKTFWVRMDPSTNWDTDQLPSELIDALLDTRLVDIASKERGYVGVPGYVTNRFVRNILSLHMRFFSRDEYLMLSRMAFDYFNQIRPPRLVPDAVFPIVEKLYHLADIVRLSHSNRSDLAIALALRDQLKKDVFDAIGNPYDNHNQNQIVMELEERKKAFNWIRERIFQDEELIEKIGDTPPSRRSRRDRKPSFLISVLDEIEHELFRPIPASLDIIRQKSPSSGKGGYQYDVTLIIPDRNIDQTEKIPMNEVRKDSLLKSIRKANSLSELVILGKFMGKHFIPEGIQDKIKAHNGPITINVNETDIPWELIHDGKEFIALRLPLGKKLRASETPRLSGVRRNKTIRPLIVGVPRTAVEGFDQLPHVEKEIHSLIEVFSKGGELEVEFNPANDVLFDDDADSIQFLIHLASEEYNIIHFAGHAVYDENSGEGGLVLADEVVDIREIRRHMGGQPLVFLNACRSAANEFVEATVGYRGSFTSGVASSFIIGGAAGCIGSMWEVLDINSIEVSTNFYKKILDGMMIGEALRLTKVELKLRDPDNKAWASYVLFGDPTTRLSFDTRR